MSLTETQITAGATYTVRIDKSELSVKRGNDAVALVKRIGQREDHAARYDAATRTWTVILPHDSVRGLEDLRTLVHAYGAGVSVDIAEDTPAKPAAPRRDSETLRASRLYGTDMAEYGSGFGPDERRAFGRS